MNWPSWWHWDLLLTSHVEARMEERGFAEVDLRAMMHDATELVPARQPGRWIVGTQFGGHPWRIVVEPDSDDQVIVVVTAYSKISR